MNIIIPCCGKGQRFIDDNYNRHKTLIKILGKNMIEYVIDGIYDTDKNINIYLIYNEELNKYNFKDLINNKYKNITCILLSTLSLGATSTVLYGLNNIKDISKKTVVMDYDSFYNIDVISKFKYDNSIIYFKDHSEKNIYSYISINDNGVITDIKEKQRISDNANTGCYCFESGTILKQYCEYIINNDIRYNNEYYLSLVVKEMIKDNHKFNGIQIDYNDFECVGTPIQLQIFCNKYKVIDKLRICFDLDNTLVSLSNINDINKYENITGIQQNIDLCNYYKSIGHYIIIYTSRGMLSNNSNIGKINVNSTQNVYDILKKYHIQYDELIFGKPYADFYIDDKGINVNSNIDKEIGIYNSIIKERCFNVIKGSKINIIKKSSNKSLDGEIFWYTNIPESIKYLFPSFIKNNSTNNYYEIEKIDGIELSYLYTNSSITINILKLLLDNIKSIHNSSLCIDKNINIYINYCNKMTNRLEMLNKTNYKLSLDLYQKVYDYLDKYEQNNKGTVGVIHGDPVFTNILLTDTNTLKFIDMKGKLDKLTIHGDIFYDYGKIYQSLLGYDEILLDKNIDINYKKTIIKYFEQYIIKIYGIDKLLDIKYITASLLITLLPLHDIQDKYQKYIDLINLSI